MGTEIFFDAETWGAERIELSYSPPMHADKTYSLGGVAVLVGRGEEDFHAGNGLDAAPDAGVAVEYTADFGARIK